MNYLLIFILLAISFLLGSIPTAYLVVKAVTGKDLRKVGSGNIGGTNAKRAADTKAQASVIYASTAIGDILKGTIPVFIAIHFTKSVDNQILRDLVRLAAAVLAVIGHDTMPFFKGGKGKGVATTAGAFLLLAPIPVLLGAASFFSLLLLTPVASRRSIISGMVIVVTCFIVNVSIVIKIGSIIAICLLLIRHKENIDRMIKGKE